MNSPEHSFLSKRFDKYTHHEKAMSETSSVEDFSYPRSLGNISRAIQTEAWIPDHNEASGAITDKESIYKVRRRKKTCNFQ